MKNSPDDATVSDIIDAMTEEQKKVTFALVKIASNSVDPKFAELPDEIKDKQMVKDVIDSMTDQQRTAMYYMIGVVCPDPNHTN